MNTINVDYNNQKNYFFNWNVVVAASIVAIAVAHVFHFLGIGLGFLAVSYLPKDIASVSLGTWTWLFLVSGATTFVGALILSYFQPVVKYLHVIFHGVFMWALMTLFTFVFAFFLGNVMLSGTASLVKGTYTAISQTAVSNVQQYNLKTDIGEQAFEQMKKLITDDLKGFSISDDNLKMIISDTKNYLLEPGLLSDEPKLKASIKNDLIEILAKNTGLNSDEIQQHLDKWQEQYQQFKNKQSERIAQGVSKTSYYISQAIFYLFLSNLFSLLTAIVGALLGAKKIISK